MSLHRVLDARPNAYAMNIAPLLEGSFHIARVDYGVRLTVPHRNFRPFLATSRSLPDKVAPGSRRAIASLRHRLKGLLHIPRRTIGQACDDGPSGEHVGIGREHGGGHRPAGGQPNDED